MPQPLLCLDAEVHQSARRFRSVFSKPHYEYFVTIPTGWLACESR